ncbi:glucan endo-1,3-beta-glucosidase 12-like [Rhodamnia argentea]|uniref:Glucan endo-1,3-beta-glucosidase 12-like n=1 Tax=Rhodamnia argentea TaxID=178133 RepID=A0A8B8PEP9_9MYRT|nr:glucan endo-1,3-beta-glucosidase 12-like [Rhodamnia argentea]
MSVLGLVLALLLLAAAPERSVQNATQTDGKEFGEWCIADEQASTEELQMALDWACGKGGADCKEIHPHRPCFLPNTVKDHASFAFNSYYQKFKHRGATCYFNSAAMITDLDPSHGSCKFEYLP